MASQSPLTLIVAATTKNGIGKAGNLPWPMLKKEMAYFARVTKRVPKAMDASNKESSLTTQNVVIMGRKTWDSIPKKLRPLKDRTNVIISRQKPDAIGVAHDNVIVADTIEHGISQVQQRARESKIAQPGRYFVIGGSSIYEAALRLPSASTILLTRIQKDYDCDTHFPVDVSINGTSDLKWRQVGSDELSEFVEEDIADEDVEEKAGDEAVRYRFMMYRKT